MGWDILYRRFDARILGRNLAEDVLQEPRLKSLFPRIPEMKDTQGRANFLGEK